MKKKAELVCASLPLQERCTTVAKTSRTVFFWFSWRWSHQLSTLLYLRFYFLINFMGDNCLEVTTDTRRWNWLRISGKACTFVRARLRNENKWDSWVVNLYENETFFCIIDWAKNRLTFLKISNCCWGGEITLINHIEGKTCTQQH